MAKKVRLTGVHYTVRARAASTANGTLASAFANGSTVDGLTLATGDLLLLKNQTTGAENGLYIVAASGAPARDPRFATGQSVVGYAVRVTAGTANANTVWAAYAEPAVIGTHDPQFIKHERNGA